MTSRSERILQRWAASVATKRVGPQIQKADAYEAVDFVARERVKTLNTGEPPLTLPLLAQWAPTLSPLARGEGAV